ncbi:MAG: hypothetical protein MR210_09620 [Erysipelotrichaceae bacterium]|nr:hypothetical protein [Erysipelotrichaceae bacterium]MDY5251538.1 hypothetical protein [Erysipelotrichaceae bacterium]
MKILKLLIVILWMIFCTHFPSLKAVRFTSYHPNDAYGSSTCTASGLCVEDFSLNAQGMYLYDDMVVLATANYQATDTQEEFSLPADYDQYHYYDQIDLIIDQQKVKGIVLDLCGACYWPEDHQRYDVFVKDKDATFDTLGHIVSPFSFHFTRFALGIIAYLTISFIIRKIMLRLRHEKKHI